MLFCVIKIFSVYVLLEKIFLIDRQFYCVTNLVPD